MQPLQRLRERLRAAIHQRLKNSEQRSETSPAQQTGGELAAEDEIAVLADTVGRTITENLIPAAAANDDIGARAAVNGVVARPTINDIVAVAAVENVIAVSTQQKVVVERAEQQVVSGAREDGIATASPEQQIVARATLKTILVIGQKAEPAGIGPQLIVAIKSLQRVAAFAAIERIVAFRALQEVVASAAMRVDGDCAVIAPPEPAIDGQRIVIAAEVANDPSDANFLEPINLNLAEGFDLDDAVAEALDQIVFGR